MLILFRFYIIESQERYATAQPFDRAVDFVKEKTLDYLSPSRDIPPLITELNKYRSDYKDEVANSLGEIKTKLMDSADGNFTATFGVYEWCRYASTILLAYRNLFDGSKKMDERMITAQKTLVFEVLDEGIAEMHDAQNKLATNLKNLIETAKILKLLNARFRADFEKNKDKYQAIETKLNRFDVGFMHGLIRHGVDPKIMIDITSVRSKMECIEKFYGDFTRLVETSLADADDTIGQLNVELNVIGNLRQQVETIRPMIDSQVDDTLKAKNVIMEVDKLITDCANYAHQRKNYSPKKSIVALVHQADELKKC